MKKLLKDKKIQILKQGSVYIPGQGAVNQWVPIHEGTLWAHYRQLSGSERFAAEAVSHTEEAVFTVNWRADIKPGFKLVYKGAEYNINRVDDYEGYKADLKLYVKHFG